MKNKETKRGTDILFAVLRIIAATVCAFLLYTFLYTISLDQINHGNIIGTAFCVSVILLVILYPWLKKHKPARIAAKIIAVLQISFALYCAVISGFILSEMISGEQKAVAVSTADGGTPQTVIVLGCQVIDGEPGPMLTLRLEKAEAYLKAHLQVVCVCTGGMGGDELAPEAVTMRKWLIDHGIGEERIYIEPESSNTTENIQFTKDLMTAEELPRNTVIVSECYHIYRGVRQAKLAGLDAVGIYADSGPVIRTLPSYWLREIFAITRDFVFG